MAKLLIHTPQGSFTWFRGPGHYPVDLAEAAGRRYWPGREPRAIEVRDGEGRLLHPLPDADRAALDARDASFKRAQALFVALPVGTVWGSCPDCGRGLVHERGVRRCAGCGYGECG